MTETAPWLILACALFNLGFGVFHLLFWRLLGWPASLAPAGGLNRAVTQTLNLMLCYCFFAVALALVLAGDGAVGRGLALIRRRVLAVAGGASARLLPDAPPVFGGPACGVCRRGGAARRGRAGPGPLSRRVRAASDARPGSGALSCQFNALGWMRPRDAVFLIFAL